MPSPLDQLSRYLQVPAALRDTKAPIDYTDPDAAMYAPPTPQGVPDLGPNMNVIGSAPATGMRNNVKVQALRKLMGLGAEDAGGFASQADTEEAFGAAQEAARREAENKAMPAISAANITGQYGLQKAALEDRAATERYKAEQNTLAKMLGIKSAQEAEAMKSGPTRVVKSLDEGGQNVEQVVDSHGNVVYQTTSQLPGSLKKEQGDIQGLIQMLQGIRERGEKSGWSGVGPVASPVYGGLKRYLGVGNDEEDQLRSALDSVKAEVAHAKYGAALTPNEIQMLMQFAPSSNLAGAKNRNNIDTMINQLMTKVGQLGPGGPVTPASKAPAGGGDPLGLFR